MTAPADEWADAPEAGSKAGVEIADVEVLSINPNDDPKYVETINQLALWHGELIKLNIRDNPTLIGDYLDKLRLNCNLLFAWINSYIDYQTELERELAVKRQNIYEQTLAKPKSSPSASEKHAGEMTRIDAANVKVVMNRIQQIKNNYERYNGICMALQSRLKEFNTERIMG